MEWNGMEGLRLANTSAVRNRYFVLVLKEESELSAKAHIQILVVFLTLLLGFFFHPHGTLQCYSIIVYSVMDSSMLM